LRRIWPSMPVRLIPPGVPAALGLSLAGLLLGLCWKAARVNTEDLRWALTIHSMRLPTWLDRWVTLLRPLGRSWLSWGLVLLTALASPQFALFLGIALAICTVAERGVKVLVNRPRPFVLLPELRPLPGLAPTDPSYPSGDAARAWLLAVFLATLPGVPPWATFLPLAAAFVVAFGRVRLGVHSPLDVLAGSCLGAGLGWAAALWLARPV
jgi:undecaprenyl-diphosphatase